MDKLFNLKKSKEIFRLGKLFSTDKNNYFYDVGTGKVLLLDDESYKILNFLFDEKDNSKLESFKSTLNAKVLTAIDDLNNIIEDENLFLAPKIENLHSYNHCENLENMVNNNLNQIILELTEKCNLRCGYCIYNESYEENRNFDDNDMSKHIAKLSIDYANKHCSQDISITFYGGEPLIKYDLLKWCIEYAKQTIKGKELSFGFTTNLTLVTKEIASYLSTIDNIHILCSLDGPMEVHDSYRKYTNGNGTFNDAIQGLKYLVDAFKDKKNNTIGINGVFTPPYTFDKIEEIDNFFKKLEWLPKNVDINIDFASPGSVDDYTHLQELKKDSKYIKNGEFINPLWIWGTDNFKGYAEIEGIYDTNIRKQLWRIHDRFISQEPIDIYPFNACCIPGSRRLYVSTKGDFYVCERIGKSPSIGNVVDGIDFEKLKKYYVDEYLKGSKDCTKCWAIRMCSTCYASNYKEKEFNKEVKNLACSSVKFSVEENLVLYHSILENQPEKLACLNDIVAR